MDNVYLIGMMGCGKTSIGKAYAKKHGRIFIDIDGFIEFVEKRSINEIFEAEGEAYFRNAEKQALQRIAQRNDTVVSCGGGIVLDSGNVGVMKESGVIVYVERTPNEILATIDFEFRPLLGGEEDFLRIYNERKPLYEAAAQKRITNTDIEKAVDEIDEA